MTSRRRMSWPPPDAAPGPLQGRAAMPRASSGPAAWSWPSPRAGPGTFDPPGFTLATGSTQRNAQRTRAARSAAPHRGLVPVRALQPAPCAPAPGAAALDTATLAFGRAEPWRRSARPRGNPASSRSPHLQQLRQRSSPGEPARTLRGLGDAHVRALRPHRRRLGFRRRHRAARRRRCGSRCWRGCLRLRATAAAALWPNPPFAPLFSGADHGQQDQNRSRPPRHPPRAADAGHQPHTGRGQKSAANAVRTRAARRTPGKRAGKGG